ncbi:DUF6262 family protein [Nostoc sp. C117]|uniref:DUF6262 family protein n=1 Tax=Nostoc sp. C117 TaxID=3349875 RepID=UPI00370DBDA0
MTVERNVEGLRDNAQKKRQEAFKKVEQGIQRLIKEKQVINFNTVAQASGVSKAWLYKQPKIKAQIEDLRDNHPKSQKVLPKQKASDTSKDAIIKTLREKLRKIEAENRGLREHLETIHGRQRALVDENAVLRRENEELTKLLAGTKAEIEIIKSRSDKLLLPSSLPSPAKGEDASLTEKKSGNSGINSAIKFELEELGIVINSTLKKAINSAPNEVTLQAITSLKEAISENRADDRVRFLMAAIKNSYVPNQDYKKKQELAAFNEWFTLAQSLGLVKASIYDEGVQYVITTQDKWMQFAEMTDRYPLEELQQIKNAKLNKT